MMYTKLISVEELRDPMAVGFPFEFIASDNGRRRLVFSSKLAALFYGDRSGESEDAMAYHHIP